MNERFKTSGNFLLVDGIHLVNVLTVTRVFIRQEDSGAHSVVICYGQGESTSITSGIYEEATLLLQQIAEKLGFRFPVHPTPPQKP